MEAGTETAEEVAMEAGDNPWAGRRVRGRTNLRDTWTFAADGRTALLDTGPSGHVVTVKLRTVKAGWLVTSRPISYLFLSDGWRLHTRLAGAVILDDEMVDVGDRAAANGLA